MTLVLTDLPDAAQRAVAATRERVAVLHAELPRNQLVVWTAGNVSERVPDLPEGVRLLLALRLEASKTSVAKYKALLNATSIDGRLRGTLQFAGAPRTARWAGRIFQPQNLPRPDLSLVADHFQVSIKEAEDLLLDYLDQGVAALEALPEPGEVEAADVASPTGSNSVDIMITGPTAEDREAANDAILAELDPVPEGVSEVASDLESDQPTAVVTVDREAAARMGLTEEAVVGLVAQQMFPGAIGTITLEDDELDIYVEGGESVDTFTQLQDLELMGSIPLTDVASVDEELSRPSISTQDGLETVTVSVTPAGEDVGIATRAANDAIAAADLPEGVEATVGGTAADIDETFGQLGIAMVAAILLVYVLLVWIFKSLIQPLIQAMSFGLDVSSMARGQYWIHPALMEVDDLAHRHTF